MTAPKAVAIIPAEDLLQTLVESDRRFTLHRVVFDLYSAVFPARVQQLVVSVVFCGGVGEYQARLAVATPSGEVISVVPFTFTARTYHIQALNLSGLLLPEPGEYTLAVELEGLPALSAPIFVADLKAPPADGAAGVED
jgi:hypothetical protein